MGEQPRVSLLVAMRNEAEHVERCLQSIFLQDYPADLLETLVLDGCSTDDSWARVARLVADRPQARLIENPGITQSRAWNLGIGRASGDLVGIVSAHAELEPDYVSRAVAALERTGADMVGGPARAVTPGLIGEAVAAGQTTRFGVGGAQFRYAQREAEVDTVFMGVCRRSLFDRVGGFDEEMVRNQDDELSYRIRDHGGRIVCDPLIRSRYFNRATLPSLWRQYFAYGFWKVRVWQKHPRQMRLSHFIPALFVTAVVGGAVLALRPGPGRRLWFGILAVYATASALSSLLASRGRWRVLPLMPLVYAVLHLAYGAGFLWGMVRWLPGGAGRAPSPQGAARPAR